MNAFELGIADGMEKIASAEREAHTIYGQIKSNMKAGKPMPNNMEKQFVQRHGGLSLWDTKARRKHLGDDDRQTPQQQKLHKYIYGH